MRIANLTSNARSRRKRNTAHIEKPLNHWSERDLQIAKEIILQHQTLCHEKENEDVCMDLFMKLKAIIRRNEKTGSMSVEGKRGMKRNIGEHHEGKTSQVDYENREALSFARMRAAVNKEQVPVFLQMNPTNVPHPHAGVPPKINDCLLTKMLKRSYPHLLGIINDNLHIYSMPFINR